MPFTRPEPSAQPVRPPRAIAELVSELQDDDADVRRTAALDLTGMAEAVRALSRRVGTESDRSARDAMLTALMETDSAAAVDGLVGYLRSDDASLRSAVAEALANMQATAYAVPALLFDPDPDVRILTVMALSALPVADVPDWLIAVVQHDSHANVVGAAVNELAEVGRPDMAEVIAEVPSRFPEDPFLKFACPVVAQRLISGESA